MQRGQPMQVDQDECPLKGAPASAELGDPVSVQEETATIWKCP